LGILFHPGLTGRYYFYFCLGYATIGAKSKANRRLFMNRTVERETIVKLLYLRSMNGTFAPDQYPQEILDTLNQVWDKLDDIDQIISINLVNWTIDRLNYVDKAIIRYAVYEMKYAKLPFEIAINEALELTKKYSNLEDNLARNFNNKLLDTIKNYLLNTSE
jgi:N utilization substance protein B